jgi:hypothetical protein
VPSQARDVFATRGYDAAAGAVAAWWASLRYGCLVDAGDFDEDLFFRSLFGSGARVLLNGRQALVALGLPVLTADYDLWVAIDDVEQVNASLAPLGFIATRSPEEARRVGRYALENSEHVDVLIARVVPTVQGAPVAFEDVWARRQSVTFSAGVDVVLPSIDDLIATKMFGARQRDLTDISLLEALKRQGRP